MPNKLTRCASAVAATVTFSVLATAALADGPYGRVDQAYEPPPPPPAPFTWRGLYVGGNIGGAWAISTLSDNLTDQSFDTDHSGFIGGVQLGYNYQIRNLVFGVDWDFDWASIGETRSDVAGPFVGTLQASTNTDWVTTVAARIGLTADRWLVFVKVGGGWVQNSIRLTDLGTGAVASTSNTDGGWLVGGGAEFALPRNWTVKLEYDVLVLSDRTVTDPLGNAFTFERDLQMLKIGLNYKF